MSTRGRIEREIRLPQLGEILNPSWSPDGHEIAFSALVGGLTDLFVYDLRTNALHRLTNDAYADLQPGWSPDGRTLAFATDRFTTNLEDLAIGPYSLGAPGPGDRTHHAACPGFTGAKHLNPQWSPDGSSLYFLSDPGGITNIYRVRLADGALTQVTNLFTGVSGITETSPALTVAAAKRPAGLQRVPHERVRALRRRRARGARRTAGRRRRRTGWPRRCRRSSGRARCWRAC